MSPGPADLQLDPLVAHHAVEADDALGLAGGRVQVRLARLQLAGVDADVHEVAGRLGDGLERQARERLLRVRLADAPRPSSSGAALRPAAGRAGCGRQSTTRSSSCCTPWNIFAEPQWTGVNLPSSVPLRSALRIRSSGTGLPSRISSVISSRRDRDRVEQLARGASRPRPCTSPGCRRRRTCGCVLSVMSRVIELHPDQVDDALRTAESWPAGMVTDGRVRRAACPSSARRRPRSRRPCGRAC